jgi:ATP-dependent DNA ligase
MQMVVLDLEAKPCFEDVLERFRASKDSSLMRPVTTKPAVFMAFDVLFIDGQDVTKLPLMDRQSYFSEWFRDSQSTGQAWEKNGNV